MDILLLSSNETVRYAATELAKSLKKITLTPISIGIGSSFNPSDTCRISLGMVSDANDKNASISASDIVDAFEINIANGSGYLYGSNPRSVLYAVYHLLREIGFEWANPQTEVFQPKKELSNGLFSMSDFSFQQSITAQHRHRGIVLEGANSPENVMELLEWMPKLYYNSYFIQFQTPHCFFSNWYAHTQNPLLKAQEFTYSDAESIKKAMELALQKYDFLYHGVGHAWTSESIGIKGLGWDPKEIPLTDWQKEKLAMVKGARQLFDKVALNTNLCYSNPEAISLFAQEVIRYLKANSSVDYLHIWLADGYNNFCECQDCRDLLPADQYIDLLNSLDTALTEAELSTKLVFLVYNDLLWAPKHSQLKNPDRFVLMFAPITRTFESSYADMGDIPAPHIYEKNRIKMPHSVEENISYLKEWQKTFTGDSFVFDYPLGRAHYGDPGYLKIAKTIYKDIQTLGELGLNGYLSCQEQRCFFPHALPNYLMGRMLWNSGLSFDEICHDFFRSSYGPNGTKVVPILEEISQTFNTDYWNRIIAHHQPWYAENLAKVPALANKLSEIIAAESTLWQSDKTTNGLAFAENWRTLSYLPEYIRKMALCLSAKASGDDELAGTYLQDFSQYVRQNELNLQPSLDVFRVLNLAHIYVQLGKPNAAFC